MQSPTGTSFKEMTVNNRVFDDFFLFLGEDSNGSTADQVMANAAETNGTTTDQKKKKLNQN